jgi:cytosine/uracil/thiamine/allantoin permease
MATIAERLAKLGAKIAPWLGWMIANNYTTYRHAYDNQPAFKESVDTDVDAAELIQELDNEVVLP